MGYGVRLCGPNLEMVTVTCLMGMSQILTAVFALAAIVVAYHLGLQQGLSLNAEASTAQREDPSDPRACRAH